MNNCRGCVMWFDKNIAKQDAGSLMIEALAMLALIAMVTPILYKKAAERTTELQDINAASQMRVMIKAVDDYLSDNYQDIMAGREVQNNCKGTKPNFSDFKNAGDKVTQVDIQQLCDYLPYGFLDNAGNVQGSYSFSGYQLAVKKHDAGSDNSSASLTGFILANPKADTGIPLLRASRIASMIGSNGGYTQGDKANGVQGIWRIDNVKNELGMEPKADGSIIAASIQSITDGSGINENVLYRKAIPGKPGLNTMETTLSMGDHNIEDVNQLIISANNPAGGNRDEALLIENGGGAKIDGMLDAAGGNFHVDTSGNTDIGGNANIAGDAVVDGSADIAGDTGVGGNLQVDGKADIAGDTTVGGNLTVNKNSDLKGNVNVGGNLNVAGNTTLNKLTVNGQSDFNGPVNINNQLTVNAEATFKEDVLMEKNLTVNGSIRTPDLRSKTLRGGLQGNDFDTGTYAFTAYWSGENKPYDVYIGVNDEVKVGDGVVHIGRNNEVQVTDNKMIAGLNNELEVETTGSGTGTVKLGPTSAAKEFVVSKGKTLVDNGVFEVQTGANTYSQILTADNRVDIMRNANDGQSLFSVEDNASATRGSVHVRKGILEVASKYDSIASVESTSAGYVKADRFIDNKPLESAALPRMAVNGYTAQGTAYTNYQINPAYTSVMHDIKLTSRGGARLSDILPDFINKGIYVVDNTYKESVPYWANLNPTVSGGTVQISGQSGYACSDYSCWTSPWLGIIPSPQCPPGYAKVVTITPAGWAMAQAGVPPSGSESTRKDLLYLNVPKNPNDYASGSADAPMPLYFQKSTWLRANVYPHGSGANFKGWSAIMGFMYPYSYYKTYIDDLGVTINKDGATSSSQWVVWNLFPVLRRQLEAYVTVYCYFDRTNSAYNSKYVDKYDQLNNFRQGWNKDSTYKTRLNDETLTFTDPW